MNTTGRHCLSANQAVKFRKYFHSTVTGKKIQLLCTSIDLFFFFLLNSVYFWLFATLLCASLVYQVLGKKWKKSPNRSKKGRKKKAFILTRQRENMLLLSWTGESKWQTEKWRCKHVTALIIHWSMTDDGFCSPQPVTNLLPHDFKHFSDSDAHRAQHKTRLNSCCTYFKRYQCQGLLGWKPIAITNFLVSLQ